MNEDTFYEIFDSIDRALAQIEKLKDANFYLDHLIVPWSGDGDRLYNGIDSVPKVGEGIQGFYEGKPYLLQVIGFSFYEVDYQPASSKSIGCLLLNPIAPSDLESPKVEDFPPQS